MLSDHGTPSIRLATESTPEAVAWAAFDTAAIELKEMYRTVEGEPEAGNASRAERMAKATEVVRLWDAFRALAMGDNEPRPAA